MVQIIAGRRTVVAKNYEELCSLVVQNILVVSQEAIKKHGQCRMALAGGSTPRGVYALMSALPYQHQFDWEHIHFFLGDERWVPVTSSRSNIKMIYETLGIVKKIPSANFHPVKTDVPNVQVSTKLYEKELRESFSTVSGDIPSFDIILLGLGEDGHTASLFPGHPAVEETGKIVASVEAENLKEKRMSLTLPVINNASHIIFLVNGSSKTEIVSKIFNEKNDLPASKVRAEHGDVTWYLDKSAAGLLSNKI
jgi:6-phosphogluconolactonase